jgi:putative oxidoreductase
MLKRWLHGKSEITYALLRMVSGTLFAFHGAQKIFGVLSDSSPKPFSQLWIGGVIELVAGALIAVGAWTTWAAFLSSGQMAVAYLQFHWKLALGARFFPAINKGELAVLYAFLFLYLACRGDGIWSVGSRRR